MWWMTKTIVFLNDNNNDNNINNKIIMMSKIIQKCSYFKQIPTVCFLPITITFTHPHAHI